MTTLDSQHRKQILEILNEIRDTTKQIREANPDTEGGTDTPSHRIFLAAGDIMRLLHETHEIPRKEIVPGTIIHKKIPGYNDFNYVGRYVVRSITTRDPYHPDLPLYHLFPLGDTMKHYDPTKRKPFPVYLTPYYDACTVKEILFVELERHPDYES